MKALSVMTAASVAIVSLAGCTSQPAGKSAMVEMAAPSGAKVYQVRCTHSPADCMNAAGETCAGPYRALVNFSNSGGLFADIIPGPVTWYTLQFACGRGDNRIPTFPHVGADGRAAMMAEMSRALDRQALIEASRASTPTTATCTSVGNTTTCSSY